MIKLNPTAEIPMAIGIPTNETKAEIVTHPVLHPLI